MCPRLCAVPRLSVETQSRLSWGWMSDPSLTLCPCSPGGSHHLAHPVHHLSCGVHRPAPLHLAVSPDAPGSGPRYLVSDTRRTELGAVCGPLPYLPNGPLSPHLCVGPPQSGGCADAVWATPPVYILADEKHSHCLT